MAPSIAPNYKDKAQDEIFNRACVNGEEEDHAALCARKMGRPESIHNTHVTPYSGTEGLRPYESIKFRRHGKPPGSALANRSLSANPVLI